MNDRTDAAPVESVDGGYGSPEFDQAWRWIFVCADGLHGTAERLTERAAALRTLASDVSAAHTELQVTTVAERLEDLAMLRRLAHVSVGDWIEYLPDDLKAFVGALDKPALLS